MAVNRLKAPRNVRIDFAPSPRQYELWKLLQPNSCPHCGGTIEQVFIGYDQQQNPQYKPQCTKCKTQNLPQLILGGGRWKSRTPGFKGLHAFRIPQDSGFESRRYHFFCHNR